MKTLQHLLDDQNRPLFGDTSDDWINDPERMRRCHDAAEFGGDGSTHQEHIDDWREHLATLELDNDIHDSIEAEIDSCEQWHVDNESINNEIG